VSKIIGGVLRFRVQFFPKVKFAQFVPEASTKGESLEFNTITVEGQIMASDYGDWAAHIEVDTLVQAEIELDKFFTEPLSNPNSTTSSVSINSTKGGA